MVTNKIFLFFKFSSTINTLNSGENCPIWHSARYLPKTLEAGHDHGKSKHRSFHNVVLFVESGANKLQQSC